MLLITKEGLVKTIIPELSLHFDNNILVMEKWVPEKPISVIYYDGEKERVFVKTLCGRERKPRRVSNY